MQPHFEERPQSRPKPLGAEKGADSSYIDEVEKHIESGLFSVDELAALPPEAHSRIILRVIKAIEERSISTELSSELLQCLYLFSDLDAEVATKLIDIGAGLLMLMNHDKFNGLDLDEIAERLIETRQGYSVARYLEKFPNLDHKRLADRLIENGEGDAVAEHLDKFNGLNHAALAEELITRHRGDSVACNLDKFIGVDHNKIAAAILKINPHTLAYRLGKFRGLDGQIATGLIEAGESELVMNNFTSFDGLDSDFARKMIESGLIDRLAANLRQFNNLEARLASALISGGYSETVIRDIKSFSESDHPQIAESLLDDPYTDQSLVANLEKFKGLDHNRLVQRLIENGNGRFIAYFLEKFQGLDHVELINKLLSADLAYYVVVNLEKFKGIDHDEIVLKLIEDKRGAGIADNLDKFPSLKSEVACRLVEYLLSTGLQSNVDLVIAKYHPQISPESTAAIYFDASVPKDIRLATETYAPGVTTLHQRARLTHSLSPTEYREALMRNQDLATNQKPLAECFKSVLEALAKTGGESAAVAGQMQTFAGLFGPEIAMRFTNRPELSRHDAFMSTKALDEFLYIQAYGESEAQSLMPGEYSRSQQDLLRRFSKVLLEVAMDDSEYYEGTAHHRFNAIIDALSITNIGTLLDEVDELDIPGLKERAAKLREERFSPLESWKGLKNAYELSNFLGKREIIKILGSDELPEATKTYAAALLQHPSISLEDLTKFLTDPRAFLEAEGRHVDSNLQNAMSPARMLEVERLGLSAVDLRDALVDGTLDRLQILPPAEQLYRFDASGTDWFDEGRLRAGFDQGLGRHKEKVKGLAKNAKKLFAELSGWGARNGLSKDDCLAWIRSERAFPPGVDLEGLAGILYDKGFGIAEPENLEIRARVGLKSDPSMIVAGNDTASCMPFGDGKTNVYSWGPVFAQFVVERKNEDGEWRTMAQSVLSLDFDAGRPAEEVIKGLRNGERLPELVPLEAFAAPPRLVCDNIEPSPNDIAAGRANIIEAAYIKFMRSYLAERAKGLGIDPALVIVGKESYLNQDRWSFKKIDNTFVPLAPLSYTDNSGLEAYSIETGLTAEVPSPREGVSTVTAADIMPMAFLEAKNYADNPDLVFGLYDRQHRIVGASIAAEKHGDPKLSFISRDAKGVPVGYIIGYLDRTTDAPEVFIDDMAVDRSRNILAAKHAMKLLDAFLEGYANHYRESGQPFPPIYAQMRETTSYRLLTRQAETLSKKFGLAIEIVEEGESSLGGETFKLVRIFVGSDTADMTASKKAFAKRQPRVSSGKQGALDRNGEYNNGSLADEGTGNL